MFIINKKSIGIDIADHSIEVAEVGKQAGVVRVLSLGRVLLSPGVIVNGRIKDAEKLEKAIRGLFESAKPQPIKAASIYLGLPEKQVFTHCFMFESKGKNEDELYIDKEAKTTIPIEDRNLIYAYDNVKMKSLSEDKKEIVKNKATIVAADREVIIEWEEFFKRFKIDVVGYDIESYAVYRGLFKKDPEYPVCVVDIGSAATNIYIYSNGGLCYSHTINKAGEMFTKNVAEIRKSADGTTIGMVDAEVLKIETGLLKTGQYKDEIYLVLSNAFRSIQAEIKIALDYYKEKTQKDIMKIVLIGGSSRMKGILDFFIMNFSASSALSTSTGVGDEKERLLIEIGKSAYLESPVALQYIEAIGIALRGVEKNKYKSVPLLEVKKSEKKDSLLSKFKKTNSENSESAVKEELGNEKKVNWFKAHPKELQLLIILFLGGITVGWAFWYRAHNGGKTVQAPIFESGSFDYAQERSKIFPVAINPAEYTVDRIKGRLMTDSVDKATTLSNALAQSKERVLNEKKRGEALWAEPLNKPLEDASIVFPLKLEWLFFSEADLKNLYTLDIKKEYSDEFMFDKLEYLKLEVTGNKNVYNLTSNFHYLTTKDIKAEKAEEKTATSGQTALEADEKNEVKIEIKTEDVKKPAEIKTELTLEELQQALKSAKGSKPTGHITILKTSTGWLNVRSGPGAGNPIIKTVLPGETYLLLEETDNWIKLDLGNDLVGWVSADYVEK